MQRHEITILTAVNRESKVKQQYDNHSNVVLNFFCRWLLIILITLTVILSESFQ